MAIAGWLFDFEIASELFPLSPSILRWHCEKDVEGRHNGGPQNQASGIQRVLNSLKI